MFKVQYKNYINQILMEFENCNVKAQVTGIAFRKLIRDQLCDKAFRRISMHQEYADHRDCIEALGQAICDKEHFEEGKNLKDTNFSGSNSRGKKTA